MIPSDTDTMLPEQHTRLTAILRAVLDTLIPGQAPEITLERPKVAAHGDVASNAAMQAARTARRNPRELAQAIVDAVLAHPDAHGLIASAEVAGPGFINFRLSAAALGLDGVQHGLVGSR